jgi:hypothetical protein
MVGASALMTVELVALGSDIGGFVTADEDATLLATAFVLLDFFSDTFLLPLTTEVDEADGALR